MSHRFANVSLTTVAALVLTATFCPPLSAAPEPPLQIGGGDYQNMFRLYEGVTVLVNNPEGKEFNLTLDVRDLNLTEYGESDALLKVYDPEGRVFVREVILDDGIKSTATQLPTGGWDHEGWYYLQQYNRGTAPMLRWSSLTDPKRIGFTINRQYKRRIPGGAKGVYRVVLVGTRDHVVSVNIDQGLKWGVAANPFFLAPAGDWLKKRYVYIPRGALGMNITLVEHDRPRSAQFVVRDDAGAVVAEGTSKSGIGFAEVKVPQPGAWDDKVFTFELTSEPGACLAHFALQYPKLENMTKPLPAPVAQACFAPDAETARALHGGSLEIEGRNYWQPAHARLAAYVNSLKPEDFEVKGADGKVLTPVATQVPGYVVSPMYNIEPNRNKEYTPLNGEHERPPVSDTIMFSYDLHRNPQALNVAIRDLSAALADIGPGDHVMNATWRGMSNQAYEFGTYRYPWWRSAWRILKEKDTPAAVKAPVYDLILNAGDRLAFCRNWERVNGNAFTTVLCGLRYAAEATGDPFQQKLLDSFHKRFTTGGFGPRVGLGPSGAIQEEFAYDNHYGAYTIATLGAVVKDFNDPRFVKLQDGVRNFYSYVFNDEAAACPFSARTFHNPNAKMPTEGPHVWKGLGGPDLTESIAGANEFFAARRPNYYMVSYHGRMTPKWEGEGFRGQMGWSGGVMCQFVVPGKGTVLASTLDNPGYGTNMHPSQWRTFRMHSIMGVTADGRPLIAADGEHLNAKLEGNTVTGSGEVRDSSVNATRSYTYNPDHVVVEAKLRMTDDDDYLNFWFKSPFRGQIAEAWEVIPFLAQQRGRFKKGEGATIVKLLDAAGKEIGDLSDQPVAGQTVLIDRGGFGVRIELEKPMQVKRGAGNTVMIQLIAETPIGPRADTVKPNVEDAQIRYKLVPFGA